MSVTNIGKSVVSHEQLQPFKLIFNKMDANDDLIVLRDDFVNIVLKHPLTTKILEEPCMMVPMLNKTVSFKTVIEQLRQYAVDPEIPFSNKSEFITWNEIEDAFLRFREMYVRKPNEKTTISNLPVSNIDPSSLGKSSNVQVEHRLDLTNPPEKYGIRNTKDDDPQILQKFGQENYADQLKTVFDTVPRLVKDYVYRNDFVEMALRDPRVRMVFGEKIREPSFNLAINNTEKDETVKQVLIRIGVEADEKICWQDVQGFLSVKGYDNTNKVDKIPQAPWKVLSQNEWIGDYPQSFEQKMAQAERENNLLDDKLKGRVDVIKDSLKPNNLSQSGQRSSKTKKSLEPRETEIEGVNRGFNQDQYDLGIVDGDGNHKVNKLWKDKEFTIPKGPKMLKRDKKDTIAKRKFDEMEVERKAKEDKELTFKFKANPLPFSTEAPRYNTISNLPEQKALIADEKAQNVQKYSAPSFYERDMEKLNKKKNAPPPVDLENKKKYASKPLPTWYTQVQEPSEDLMKKEEEKKKQKMARMAEMLANSANPVPEKDKTKAQEKQEKTRADMEKENKFAPKINKNVPDTKAEQEKFQKELEKRKEESNAKQAKTTVTGFALSETKKPKVTAVDQKKIDEDYFAAQEQKKEKAKMINLFMSRVNNDVSKKEEDGKKKLNDINKKKEEDKNQLLENKKKAMKSVGASSLVSGLLGGNKNNTQKKSEALQGNTGNSMFQTEDVDGGDQSMPTKGLFQTEDVDGGDQSMPTQKKSTNPAGGQGGLFQVDEVEGGDQALPEVPEVNFIHNLILETTNPNKPTRRRKKFL